MEETFEIYPPEAEELCQSAQIERYIPQKERDSYSADDFAGPGRTFPVTSQAQLDAAAHLIGHAADPEAVKRKAIAIAKRKGFTLPKAWQEDEGEKKDDSARDVPTEPERVAPALTASDRVSLYMPLVRVSPTNSDEWLVEGQATSDVVDHYKTIFEYESIKRAFERWRGNVREMHDRKAVGRGVKWIPDDTANRVVLRTRISKGAPDTWEKVLDGTLNAYSISLKPGYKEKYTERDGQRILTYYDFDYAEVSLVDSPGSPGCDIAIVRADGMATEILDTSEEEAAAPVPVVKPVIVERAGKRVSNDTQGAMHDSIGQTLKAATSQMANCGCDTCQSAMKTLDPDGDGDIDLGGYDDPDGDSKSVYASAGDEGMDRAVAVMIERLEAHFTERIERMFSPVYQRQQQFLARMAQTPEQQTIPTMIDTTALEERLLTAIERVAASSSQSEVRAELSAVKATVERIAAQPLPGGPVLNGAMPVDKRLATQPHAYNPQPQQEDTLALLQRLQASGALDTPDKQVAAAALAAIPARGRMV